MCILSSVGEQQSFKFCIKASSKLYKTHTSHSSSHSLAFGGGGDGGNAIRLDKNLCSGSTEKCATFSSPELSDVAEFKIYRVELWGPAPM
mmetsp:Transcript_25711/g.41302  ORF Transcript_25711/g.41302 Transcript_25711/m.41302 type:complete len:90 (-) Transcript_25711:185-454(-)